MPGTPKKTEIPKQSSGRFVIATLLAALMLNLLPWGGIALSLRPDFMALAVLYWCVREPRKSGIGTAWGMGLLMDVADGVLLGQHALAYSLAAFLALVFHLRIRLFAPWQQAIYVLGLLLLLQSTALLIRLATGAVFPGMGYFLPSLTGALFWPLLPLLMQLPHPAEQNDTLYSAGQK